MKALLLKDWYVLRKQVWSYLLIVLVWGLIPSLTLNLLAVVYGAMIPYTAMAYDQRSRWDKFARLLPYSDRTVVLSRYALGWISLSVGAFAVAICQGVLTCLPLPAKLSANLSPRLCIRRPVRWVSAVGSEYTSHPSLRHRKGPVGRHSHHLSHLCFRRRAQRIGQ